MLNEEHRFNTLLYRFKIHENCKTKTLHLRNVITAVSCQLSITIVIPVKNLNIIRTRSHTNKIFKKKNRRKPQVFKTSRGAQNVTFLSFDFYNP